MFRQTFSSKNISHKIISLANFVTSWPKLVIFFSLALTIIMASGAKNIAFNTNYRIFFADENPQMADFDEIERVYIKTDNILFTVKPKNSDVFSKQTLKLVQELTEESWQLPYSQRVDSITNFQHSFAEDDDMTVVDLVEEDLFEGGAADLSAKKLQDIKQIALTEPLIAGKLISKDGRTTGVNVFINLPGESAAETPEVTAAARELTKKYQAKYPDIQIKTSGVAFMNNAFAESSQQDVQNLMPIMFLIIILVMIFLLRSFAITFATLIIVIFSAIVAVSFAGWAGFDLSPPSASTPTIVLTLAIADSIHIIMSMIKAMQNGSNKKDAIIESIRINFQPVFLTSLTTIIGFLSMNFSESPPFWHLGNMTAIGIGAAFLFSILLLPALLMVLPVKINLKKANKNKFWDNFSNFIIKHNIKILLGSSVTTVFIGLMIFKIEINDQFVQYFDHSISFRPDTEFMMKNLSGIYTLEYSVNSKGKEQISDPQYLQNLENFSNWLKKQPEVDHVFSVTDIFKRLNKNMHGDDAIWYKVPDNKEMASQYLLLYELSLPYGLDLNDRINIDKSATRLTATVKDLSTKELRAFKTRSETWLQKNTPKFMHASATSTAVMFSFISERNINSMVSGNTLSLFLISAIILIALRNVRIGLISLIPNLTPLILGLGIWGIFIGQINMAAGFAFAVSLGIIVDDTVHFLSKYLRARREKNLSTEEAIKYAFNNVGSALLVTTLILVAGFLVLAQSSFQINGYLGLLSAIIIFSALILDFLLLPTLLLFIDNLLKRKNA
jgi:uncharacterized protein